MTGPQDTDQAEPEPPRLPDGWSDLPFYRTDWPDVQARLRADPRPWLPGPDRVFAALDLVAPASVRVVILGQDPYPNPAHAMGLAFSVPPGTRPLPRSLTNIFKELQDDLGVVRGSGDLTGWARQGVLLLNPVLSVPSGDSHGHKGLGWQVLTREVLDRVARRPTAFVLWGQPAAAFAGTLSDRHLVIRSPHPSPLSAHRGFFGSRPFSRINHWLEARGDAPIDWST